MEADPWDPSPQMEAALASVSSTTAQNYDPAEEDANNRFEANDEDIKFLMDRSLLPESKVKVVVFCLIPLTDPHPVLPISYIYKLMSNGRPSATRPERYLRWKTMW
jgi:hypothetical protein